MDLPIWFHIDVFIYFLLSYTILRLPSVNAKFIAYIVIFVSLLLISNLQFCDLSNCQNQTIVVTFNIYEKNFDLAFKILFLQVDFRYLRMFWDVCGISSVFMHEKGELVPRTDNPDVTAPVPKPLHQHAFASWVSVITTYTRRPFPINNPSKALCLHRAPPDRCPTWRNRFGRRLSLGLRWGKIRPGVNKPNLDNSPRRSNYWPRQDGDALNGETTLVRRKGRGASRLFIVAFAAEAVQSYICRSRWEFSDSRTRDPRESSVVEF